MTNSFRFPGAETRFGRRDALRIGGITLSLGAVIAACGGDTGGDEAPGRVGYAPPVTDPQNYTIDDAVLLRSASSVEYTIIAVYENMLARDVLDEETTTLLEHLIEDHQQIADEMGELTTTAGGEPWTCPNTWITDRLVKPVFATISTSDSQAEDLVSFAISLESSAAASNQLFAEQLTTAELRLAAISAAILESRHAAALPIAAYGPDAYVDPAVLDQEVAEDTIGLPQWYAITSTFGSTGQVTLVVGTPDDNGTRTSYFLQTPADNSYVYNELEPTC